MTADGVPGVAEGALRWLWVHRAGFQLPPDYTSPQHDRSWTVRPLGELAQISHAIGRLSGNGGEVSAAARELFDFAWQATGRGEAFASLARREPHAAYPLELYAVFAEAGLRHEPFEGQLRAATATRAWRLVEVEPTRRLAVLQAERRLGWDPHTDPELAQRRTWLGGLPEPWCYTTGAGYDATHYVFHLTNWGVEPGQLPAAVREYLMLWLPAWLECTVEAGNWDLTGELLAVAAVLAPPEPLSGTEAAWRVLRGVQDADGSVPESEAEPADADDGSTFRLRYHSTLVAAFAAVLTNHAAARAEMAATAADAATTEAGR